MCKHGLLPGYAVRLQVAVFTSHYIYWLVEPIKRKSDLKKDLYWFLLCYRWFCSGFESVSIELSQRPAHLVTVAMSDKPCHSHATYHVLTQWKILCEQRGNWQHANRQDRAGYFWYETKSQLSNFKIQTLNIVSWLFNASWEITVVPQFKWHMIRSSFHIYLTLSHEFIIF